MLVSLSLTAAFSIADITESIASEFASSAAAAVLLTVSTAKMAVTLSGSNLSVAVTVTKIVLFVSDRYCGD